MKKHMPNRNIIILIGIIIICCTSIVLTGSTKSDHGTNAKELKEILEETTDKDEKTNKEEAKEKEKKPEKIYYAFNEKELVDLIDSANGAKVLSTYGDANLSEDVLNNIQNEITNLERQKVDFSFVVLDINRRFGIAYNADWITTSESTIKAPYGCSLLEVAPDLYEQYKYWFDPMIKMSDNYSYEALRYKFGIEYLRNWYSRANVDISSLYSIYPTNMRVRDMAKFWVLIYEFLNSDKVPLGFKIQFNGTYYSSIYAELGKKYYIQSKPGWYFYDGPESVDKIPWNEEQSLNDAGVIYAGGGPYILAIFSHSNPDVRRLGPIISAIDEAVASAPEYK